MTLEFDIRMPVLPHAPSDADALLSYFHSLSDSEVITIVGRDPEGAEIFELVKVGPRDTLPDRIMTARAVIEVKFESKLGAPNTQPVYT